MNPQRFIQIYTYMYKYVYYAYVYHRMNMLNEKVINKQLRKAMNNDRYVFLIIVLHLFSVVNSHSVWFFYYYYYCSIFNAVYFPKIVFQQKRRIVFLYLLFKKTNTFYFNLYAFLKWCLYKKTNQIICIQPEN